MFLPVAFGTPSGGGAAAAPPQPPAPTQESVFSGDAPASFTFSAFTDTDGVIATYVATITNVVGSTTIASGSGLGPYTFDNYEDGDNFVLTLEARNSDGDAVATAVRAIYIQPSTGTITGTGLAFLFATQVSATIGTAGTLT